MMIRFIPSNIFRFTLLWSLVFYSGLKIYCQDSTEFNFQNGVWIEEEESYKTYTIYKQRYCNGDTIINDQSYNKLFESSIGIYMPGGYPDTVVHRYIGAIKENEFKQVYYIFPYQSEASKIYDFNLKLGDTIRLWSTDNVVDCIDSIEICGKLRTRYRITNPGNSETLVEGVGFSNGLLGYNSIPSSGESYNRLVCYTEKLNSDCAECRLLLSSQSYRSVPSILFPNPTHDLLNIQTNKIIYSIEVLDIQGTVFRFNDNINSNFYILNLNKLYNGFYTVKIQFDDCSKSSSIILKF